MRISRVWLLALVVVSLAAFPAAVSGQLPVEEPVIPTPTPEPVGLSRAVPPDFKSGLDEARAKGVSLIDVVDADVEKLWRVILERQYQYNDMTGGFYFQGLQTGPVPAIGEKTPFVDWWRSPMDQAYKWTDIAIVPIMDLPFAIAIDVYDGPQGRGFVARFLVRVEKTVYSRSLNEGPETWHNTDWQPAGQ